MRLRVVDVLDLLTNGLSVEDILQEFPKLEKEDILAAINFSKT